MSNVLILPAHLNFKKLQRYPDADYLLHNGKHLQNIANLFYLKLFRFFVLKQTARSVDEDILIDIRIVFRRGFWL